jgi:hypothetical protein
MVDGANVCSLRADAKWPSWCHDRWVMADDIDSRADIREFAAAARAHNARVVWAPGYTTLDGYASRFGGIVVIQAEYVSATPSAHVDGSFVQDFRYASPGGAVIRTPLELRIA